jgi:xanthine dehydrogenase small subunit
VLLATDASVVLTGMRGERTIPAAAFWTGYRRTARASDELVLGVRIPLPAGRVVRVRKVGTRRAQAISKVVMAVAWRAQDGAWRDVRVALGSVADRPVRAHGTEALLEGELPTPDVAERASATCAAEIAPIDDVRSSASYRRAVTGRILRRVILDAAGE